MMSYLLEKSYSTLPFSFFPLKTGKKVQSSSKLVWFLARNDSNMLIILEESNNVYNWNHSYSIQQSLPDSYNRFGWILSCQQQDGNFRVRGPFDIFSWNRVHFHNVVSKTVIIQISSNFTAERASLILKQCYLNPWECYLSRHLNKE